MDGHTHWKVLAFLDRTAALGAKSTGEIAAGLGLPEEMVSLSLNRLVRAGVVRRIRGGDERWIAVKPQS